jgi:hypothetical protein
VHERSQQQVDQLQVGQQLPTPDGPTTLLKLGRVHPAGPGSYAWREAIRTLPGNDVHPFVVHRVVFQDDEPLQESPLDGRWVFDVGDYCQTIEQALTAFERREGPDHHDSFACAVFHGPLGEPFS